MPIQTKYYILALLQRLRRITGGRNASTISSSNCRRENISKNKNIIHHSDLQHNHDNYFNLTNLGGYQTPASQDSTTDINERGVINDNARSSSTRHSHNLFAHTPRTSNVLYDSLNADTMHCEQNSPCSTPHLSKSVITGKNLIVSKGASHAENQLKQVVVEDYQAQRINEGQATNTRCKPTYVHLTFPQISVKRNSSSAEIIL